MPVKDSIELGEGRLYFTDTDEGVDVKCGEISCVDEISEDDLKHMSIGSGPFEFTCQTEFNNNWTTVKCKECGTDIPVTEFYTLLYGTVGWTCPRCTFNKAIEEARKRSKT
jgi:hypothetical protein